MFSLQVLVKLVCLILNDDKLAGFTMMIYWLSLVR